MLIALTLPLTFHMEAGPALSLLVSMYVGAVSGGLITATLLRMPGTPAAVITTLDGWPMARRGESRRALLLGVGASLVGGLVSWLALGHLARPLAEVSHHLGPWDMFALIVAALALIAAISPDHGLLAGILSGLLGMLAAAPGLSLIHI